MIGSEKLFHPFLRCRYYSSLSGSMILLEKDTVMCSGESDFHPPEGVKKGGRLSKCTSDPLIEVFYREGYKYFLRKCIVVKCIIYERISPHMGGKNG